ncbi:MAG TPA: deaminase domain-containing protein [Herpetosiphonaceae bacterium]
MHVAQSSRLIAPTKRPLGVTLITLHALLFAGLLPLFLKFWLLASGSFNGEDVILFAVSMAVHALILPIAIATWTGHNRARVAFMALIGLNYAIDVYVNFDASMLPNLTLDASKQMRLIALRSTLWGAFVIWYFLRDKTRAWFEAASMPSRYGRWRDEQGSNVAQAAAVALVAAALITAVLLASRDVTPRVENSLRCLAGAITGGGGADCGLGSGGNGSTPTSDGTGSGDSSDGDDGGGGWGGFLDGVQLVLDGAGLIPGFGEIADGANALISLARGNYGDAALSAAAMIPFLGWGATGAKWGKRGVDAVNAIDAANDTRRAAGRADEAIDAARRIPCLGSAPGKTGLAAPLAAPCLDVGNALRDRAVDARTRLGPYDQSLAAGGRNVATARVEINGQNTELWDSVNGPNPIAGTVPPPSQRLFQTRFLGVNREYDTEVKILEEAARRMGVTQPGRYDQFTGRIDLYTERAPCGSCGGTRNNPMGVIQQFREMFPNIELNVYYGNNGGVQVFNK